MWPFAIGWWFLLTLILFVAFWIYIKIRKQSRVKKQHQFLFGKIEELEYKLRQNPSNETLAAFNTLLRQLAIVYYPRTEIASLTGAAWIHFLDQSGNTQDFSQGAGRILLNAPYRSGNMQNLNIEEFIPMIKSWVSWNIKNRQMQKAQIIELSRLKKQNENPLKGGGVSFE